MNSSKTNVSYLGNVVSDEVVETKREKTEALKALANIQECEDVHGFFGFTGYYARKLDC